MVRRVYDFVAANGVNQIALWLSALDKFAAGRMHLKLDVLLTAEDDLPPKMLTDTKESQIKELRANTKVAMRLLLCKGPDPKLKNEELTLLFGATERDNKYVPKNALALAETNRLLVLNDPIAHRILRTSNADSQKTPALNG